MPEAAAAADKDAAGRGGEAHREEEEDAQPRRRRVGAGGDGEAAERADGDRVEQRHEREVLVRAAGAQQHRLAQRVGLCVPAWRAQRVSIMAEWTNLLGCEEPGFEASVCRGMARRTATRGVQSAAQPKRRRALPATAASDGMRKEETCMVKRSVAPGTRPPGGI